MVSLVPVVSCPRKHIQSKHKHIKNCMHAGRHCCLYCEITSEAMRTPLSQRGHSPSRTLDSLQCDYLQFMAQGGGNIRNAKHFKNVIASSLFNVPVSQVKSMHYYI